MANPYTNALRFLLTECLRKGDSHAVSQAEHHIEAITSYEKQHGPPPDAPAVAAETGG